jgi:hypothetical protein
MSARFRLPNYKHQQDEWDRHRDDDARALLWQMRTGKTKSTIDLACYRHEKRDIGAMLIIAPNGVHVNWLRRQFPQHLWENTPMVGHAWQASEAHRPAHAAGIERVMSAPDGTLAVLAVNSESLIHDAPSKLVAKFIRRFGARGIMLAVDECHDFRTPGSKRTKRARSLHRYCRLVRILTGTSVDNSPLAAYAQFELLKKGALGFERFADFEAAFASYRTERTKSGRTYPVLDAYRDLDVLQERMSRLASVVLREDVDDMPDLVKTERTVLLPDAQVAAYRTLAKEMILELEAGGEVTAVEGGARLIKLQQMLSGWVVDSVGDVRDLVADEDNARLNAMLDEVGGTGGKVIIWCQFREDIRRVTRALANAKHGYVEYHGAIISQAKRQAAIDAFQTDPRIKAFVGQPAAGGQGLDLSAADAVLWYSHTSNLITRNQADERGTQIGGKSVAIVDFVVPGSVDEHILRILESKRDVAESLAGRGLRDRLIAFFRTQL